MYRHRRPTVAHSLRYWRQLPACLSLPAAWLTCGYVLPRWLWPDGGGAAYALAANLVFFVLCGTLIFHLRASLKAVAEERELLDCNRSMLSAELRAIFDATPSAILLIREGVIQHANQAAAQMSGYALGALADMPLSVLFDSGELADKAEQIAAALARGETVRDQTVMRRRDGTRCWLNTSGRSLHSDFSEKRSVWILEDVGVFRQAEEKLRESERRWQFALEGAEQGVWDIDLVAGIAYYSPRWRAMLGYREDDPIERWNWKGWIHPDDRRLVVQELRRHCRGETDLFRCEYRMRRSNGDYLWVLTRGRICERNADGRPTRITGTNTDLSRRKAMERALRTREQVQRELMDALPLGLYQMDREGRVVFANRYMRESFMVGCEEDLSGKCIYDMVPDSQDGLNARAWDQEVLASGVPQSRIEEYLLPSSGQRRFVEVGRIPHRNAAGEVTGLHGFYRDITEQMRAEQALRASERLYRSLGDVLPMALFRLDRAGRIIFGNKKLAEMLGMGEQEFLGRNMFEMTPEPHRQHAFQQYLRVIEEGKTWTTIEEHQPLGVGEPRYLEITRSPVRDESGQITGEQGVFRDVTEQVLAEQQLRMTSLVFETTHQAALISDAQRRVLKVNRAFSRITGYDPEDVIGKTHDFMRSGLCEEHVHTRIDELLARNGHWEGELWGQRKNGDTYPMFITMDGLRGEDGEIRNYVTMCMDISERKANEEKIHHLARHDQLTELPNRSLLRDRVDAAIEMAARTGKPFALMFLDLDRFKQINDSLGHAFGDQLLRETARRLKESVRSSDTVSRHGGDEFIVLLPDVGSDEDVRIISRKLIKEIGRPYVIDGKEVIVTLSVGIAMYPEDGKDIDALLHNADTALYATKEAGRNDYRFYSAEMNTPAEQRLQIENDLRHALERDELFLEYQPQFDLDSREIVGVEALVRWRHPRWGVIAPGEFIPVAEDSGLIVELGAWVMEAACRQQAAWLSSGLAAGHVSVNVSGHQFRHRTFIPMVLDCLQRSGLDAACLELEMTETVIMQATQPVTDTMNQLANAGVRLSIDDFGTGYSSLSYLKYFPIDRLKIDQSFVRELPRGAGDVAIVRAVAALGLSLELSVLAEGIETEEQLNFLHALGCQAGQGYLLARPQSASDCERLIRDQIARKSPKAVSRA